MKIRKQKTTYPKWWNLYSWGFLTFQTFKGYYLGVFSIIYIIILTGNSLIIILTRLDPTLQKPMYFFLANFSSLEICTCLSLSLGFWWTFGLRTEAFLCWTVLPKRASSLSSEPLSASSWRWWPVTAAWPSVALCTVPWSWPQRCASSWLWAPGQWNPSADRANVPDLLSALLSFERD